MGVEGGMKCVKYLVFIFNLLFWFCGIALIGLGIFVQVHLNNSVIIRNASSAGPAIVLIAVGVIIFLISFFGCCGAARENYCMVTTFAVLLTLVFLVEIAAAIAGYVFRDKVQDAFKDAIVDGMKKYGNDSNIAKGVDDLQRDFKCCGATNSSDWANYEPFKTNKTLPESCCVKPGPNCFLNQTNVFSSGCSSSIENWFKTNVGIVAGVALGIAFFELLGVVFACCLMKGIRSGYEVM